LLENPITWRILQPCFLPEEDAGVPQYCHGVGWYQVEEDGPAFHWARPVIKTPQKLSESSCRHSPDLPNQNYIAIYDCPGPRPISNLNPLIIDPLAIETQWTHARTRLFSKDCLLHLQRNLGYLFRLIIKACIHEMHAWDGKTKSPAGINSFP